MIMTRYGSMFVSALVVLGFATIINGAQLPNGGKIWAFVASGSAGYANYRHQADVCNAYQVLHANGIPDDNIIVMMYDDIANNTKNPKKGVVRNAPGGPNVYEGILKDYTGQHVTPANFLRVLSGDEEGMKGVGSGRVIKSGPNDFVFINLVDHGAKGIVGFPHGLLYATDLIKTLKKMAANKQFAKLVFYLEACESGSMFDNLLPNNINVFAVTASSPTQSAYSTGYDWTINAWTGDQFSVSWMRDAAKENLTQETLQHQYEVARRATSLSHVEEYGDLTMGSLPVSDFLGSKSSTSQSLISRFAGDAHTNDHVSSRDAHLAHLQRKKEAAQTPEEKHEYEVKIQKLLSKRRHIEQLVHHVLMKATGNDEAKVEQIKDETYNLKSEDFDCYKKLVSTFSEKCVQVHRHTHALKQLRVFANVCGRKDISEDSVVKAIADVCPTQHQLEEDDDSA